MDPAIQRRLREIPALSELLLLSAVQRFKQEFGAGVVKFALRELLAETRQAIQEGDGSGLDAEALAAALRPRLARLAAPAGRRVINATGILLHTGLGRAPLCDEAVQALAAADGYAVLQARLDTGKRARRGERLERLLVELTGAEAAAVVNNNAAATMLILNTLAAGREVIISRGQLIEIGGEFRMPDVMTASGVKLREIGTTNRTHLRDYENAINENTGAIAHVHTSNYRVRGFAGTPDIRELVALGRQHDLPVIDDLGSGALVSLAEWGLPDEPLVAASIGAGADAVCFSGDKLIGGPQAGIICGRRGKLEQIRKNPLMRMFRVGKLTEAALTATLLHFLNGTYRHLPLYRQLSLSLEALEERAGKVAGFIAGLPGVRATVGDDLSQIGGGSIPDQGIPTRVLRVSVDGRALENVARQLRNGIPSVFCRIKEEALVFDLRPVLAGEVETLGESLRRALTKEE